MQISEEYIKEFQEIYKKKYGKEIPRDEAVKQANDLVNFVKLMLDLNHKDHLRKKRLEKEPKGFNLTDGVYSCCICYAQVTGDESWYDKNGIKCMFCQKALDCKLIPAFVCRDDDSWYSVWEFDRYFGIKHQKVRKLIRSGKLKARVVPGMNGSTYFELILLKDNKDILPRKSESKLVQNEDGSVSTEYVPVDIDLVEKLIKLANS